MSIFLDVEIRDTVTGISAVYHDTYAYSEEEDDYTISFMWDDGNYGCDCNRSIFLNVALGGHQLEGEFFPEIECNLNDETRRLRVEVRDRASGRILFADMEHRDDFICLLPKS